MNPDESDMKLGAEREPTVIFLSSSQLLDNNSSPGLLGCDATKMESV
jgi:hypothetical protein